MKLQILRIKNFLFIGALTFSFQLSAQSLQENFKNPPTSAKPKTWMHAMSSNMSKEGLTKDLESIKKVGIGGLLLFNISQGIPNGPVKYNSELHHSMIAHAAKESERLGLTFGVHNCDGWTSSGGPWITPEESMKMAVWSETIIASNGKNIKLKLSQPTTREGFYKDIAVVAYPALASEMADLENKPTITSSDNNFDASLLIDGKVDRATNIKMTGNKKPWVQYEYKTPATIRSVYMIFVPGAGEAELQYSNDGKEFKSVKNLFKVRTGKGEWGINESFEPVTSRFFRLQLNDEFNIKEAKLLSTQFVQNVLGLTSMARTEDADLKPIGTPVSSMVINKNNIIDLSTSMTPDGTLIAKLPKGNWTIMRFGFTSTSAFNWPASDEGRGLECDKFSKAAIEKHYNSFVKRVVDNSKKEAPNALQYVEIDSYEMGGQNWTDGFESIFKKRKGYDIKQFLPLFAGRFIENAASTEAILWDMRNVCSDLMTENYYGYFTELCHRDGLKTYFEPYGFGPLNNLDIGGKADMNMGEFWMSRPLRMDEISPAVSASHIYGKEITSAESFTSLPEINWKGNPSMAKITGDKAWAAGINEFMFHRFAHQANPNVKPGMTMNRWGFHFDRTQTWWENAGADWFKYIARGSYLLRQGVPVSDMLVYIGEGSPNSIVERIDLGADFPVGINYDCVNTDVLKNRIEVKDGKMVLPEGTTYKMLVLKNCEKISLETLKRIHQLSKEGVAIVGTKPVKIAGYISSQADGLAFQKLVNEIWERSNTYADFNWGKILKTEKLSSDFQIVGRDDITFMHRKVEGTDVYFSYNPDSVARQFEVSFRINGKIPELWNPMTGTIKKLGNFTQSGDQTKVSVTLDAEESMFIVFSEPSIGLASVLSSESEPFSATYLLDGDNNLFLEASKNGLYKATTSTNQKVKFDVNTIPLPIKIQGAWNVEFLKKNDYEAKHTFNKLSDWKDSPVDEIQHYSGTAIYRKAFTLSKTQLVKDQHYILDLGDVKIVAAVKLNGSDVGIDWMPPFELDITKYLKVGENQLEIELTNQWSNRLIGDERYPISSEYEFELEGNFPKKIMPNWYINQEPLPSGKRTTFSTARFYKATDPLMPSGLLGPVQIKVLKSFKIESNEDHSKVEETNQTKNNDGYKSIFNGKTLAGWKGDPTYWRVENGNLVGEVTPETLLKTNTFIIWQDGLPANFELKLEYRISESGNSGINYRSDVLSDNPNALRGYQADIDGKNRYTGQNYEERKRTTLAYRGEKVRIENTKKLDSLKQNIKANCWQSREVIGSLGSPDSLKTNIKANDWNQVHLIIKGNILQHYINDVLMSEVIDNDTVNQIFRGHLGVQVHVGPPMKIEYRNIQLRNLK